jgi:hypothetical protein
MVLILLLSLSFSSAWAEQCGLFQINDYGDRISYTLVDFSRMAPRILNYRIVNDDSPLVRGMVNGLCYCVDGTETVDPQFNGDLMYRLLRVGTVNSGPTQDCTPGSD